MSAIEKVCRLSLALDRVYRHGHLFLSDEIESDSLREAIANLHKVISKIPQWEEFIERESEWWVDLSDEKVYE